MVRRSNQQNLVTDKMQEGFEGDEEEWGGVFLLGLYLGAIKGLMGQIQFCTKY